MSVVHYDVPGICQGPHNTCWLACFRMLVKFRLRVRRPVNAIAMALLDSSVISRFEVLNRGLDPDRFELVARRFGLSALHVPGLTRALRGSEMEIPGQAFDVLQRRGPFSLGGTLPNGSGHAIVICGASDEPGYDIEFIDPRSGNMRHLAEADLRRGFPPDGGALFVF